jgi:hypothetical protein
MPKFFINFLDSSGISSADGEGQDLPGLEEAEATALASARELLADDVTHASKRPLVVVTITNENGDELKRISVKDVLPEALK